MRMLTGDNGNYVLLACLLALSHELSS